MKIIRKKLTPDELVMPSLRYDPTSGYVQQTNDGTTWVNAPQSDPRAAPAYLRPPLTLTDARCEAAAGITANLKAGIDATVAQLAVGASAVGMTNALFLTFADLTGIGLFISLMLAFCTAIIGIGTAGMATDFTSGVYATLNCLFYDNMDGSGQVSAAQFANLQSEVAGTFGALSDVNIVIQGWLAPLGNVGLSNLGVIHHVAGDCSGCLTCAAYTDHWLSLAALPDGTVIAPAWAASPIYSNRYGGTYLEGNGSTAYGVYGPYTGYVIGVANSSGVEKTASVLIDFGHTCVFTDLSFNGYVDSGTHPMDWQVFDESMTLVANGEAEFGAGTWHAYGFGSAGIVGRYVYCSVTCVLAATCYLSGVGISVA